MPHSFLEKIGRLNLKPTNMTLQFIDGSKMKVLWKVVNVTIKVKHLIFIIGFFFCHGYRGGPTSSNHLGRYFIRTTHVTDQCS